MKKQIIKIISKITKKGKGDKMFLYFYFAGHGCSDMMQKFILNEEDPELALFNAEETLRMMAKLGRGLCYLFAVYDICRENSSFLDDLISKQKA